MPPAEATDHVARIQEQFSRQAEAYKRLKIVTDPRMIAAVVSASGVRPGDRVVDFACGPGFLTMGFAERAAEAVGVDVTDTFLDGARAEAAARGLRNVSFIHGDVTRLQFPRQCLRRIGLPVRVSSLPAACGRACRDDRGHARRRNDRDRGYAGL